MHNLLSFWLIRFLWNQRLRQEKWVYGGWGRGVGGRRGRASIGQWRSRLSRSYYVFFPLYLRMRNNTVMLLSSRTELWTSKQYYFLTSLLPLFVCSTRIMYWEWWAGVGCLLAVWLFACFHLYPLSSVNMATTGQYSPYHLMLSCGDWACAAALLWSIVIIPLWQKKRVRSGGGGEEALRGKG